MRIQCTGVEQNPRNGKYSVKFDLIRGIPGNEYVGATTQSADVFLTEEQALEGATRAVDMFVSTGRFPNMCEAF